VSTPASAGDAAEPTQPVADRAHGSRRRLLAIADTNFIWVLLLLVMAVASLTSTSFLSASNLSNVLLASASLGCLVIAQGLVLLTGNFDLSTESSMILSAIVGTIVMESATGGAVLGTEAGGLGWPWWAGLIVMLVVPMFVGLLNGVMIVRLRMNPFMVTLAVSIILPGIALILGEGQTLVNVPPDFRFLGRASIGPVPAAGIVLLVLFLVVHVLLSRTVFGRQLYAVGSNRHAARAAGISDQRVIASAYILCGLFVGFAAFLLVGRLGAASAGISSGALFLSVAAAVIGGVSLNGGKGTMFGAFTGILLLFMIQNVLTLAGVPAQWIGALNGAIILIALVVSRITGGKAQE